MATHRRSSQQRLDNFVVSVGCRHVKRWIID
jgi:hypothetical protein